MSTDTKNLSHSTAKSAVLLTEHEAAALTGYSVWWFRDHRRFGTGPNYLRVQPRRSIRYERDKLLEWFRQFEVKNEQA